jgi:hypothetical protein
VEAVLPRRRASEAAPSAESDTLDQLVWRGFGVPVRLHLTCDDQLLPGYINIDGCGDLCADIAALRFLQGSVDEIRVRHIERFSRLTALRLLIRYELWLKPGCPLLIETHGQVHVVLRRKLRNLQSLLQCCVVTLSVKIPKPHKEQ